MKFFTVFFTLVLALTIRTTADAQESNILIGAGLFGFTGMLLGVPVFVVIYTFINGRIQSRLKNSDLPEETAAYQDLDHIDPVTRQAVKKEESGKSEKSE